MKAMATGLLLAVAAVYLVARVAEARGGPAWTGYLRAATEAGMVGALADWFAVTALFRHPFGLPIPHTAIIPTKKDQLAASLGTFVGENFLSEEVVRLRLANLDLASRVGDWLCQPQNVERVGREGAAMVRGLLGVLSDEEVRTSLEASLSRYLARVHVGPPLGRLLEQVVVDGAHHELVDLAAGEFHRWVAANRDLVVSLVSGQAPSWSPRFVGDLVGTRIHTELLRISSELAADRDHPLRQALDRFLSEFSGALQHDPPTIARADEVAANLLRHVRVRGVLAEAAATARIALLDAVEDPSSPLRRRADESLARLGHTLQEDPQVRAKLDRWAADAVVHVTTTYRDEITTTITETVARWDAQEASRRIELQVGRDLQFIRINGTVVGALAGLAIYTVTELLL